MSAHIRYHTLRLLLHKIHRVASTLLVRVIPFNRHPTFEVLNIANNCIRSTCALVIMPALGIYHDGRTELSALEWKSYSTINTAAFNAAVREATSHVDPSPITISHENYIGREHMSTRKPTSMISHINLSHTSHSHINLSHTSPSSSTISRINLSHINLSHTSHSHTSPSSSTISHIIPCPYISIYQLVQTTSWICITQTRHDIMQSVS